jgi:type IV pilus assembly protein PilO
MTPTGIQAAIQSRAALQQGLFDRIRGLVTALNLHYAGVGLLVLVNLYLLIHMGFAWQTASSQDATAVASQTATMHAAEQATQPLRGLDGKLTEATSSADRFYDKRLPFADSQVVAELGALVKKQGVKLSRGQYAYSPVMEGSAGAVTEFRMDVSLSGDYRPLMVVINQLERDRMFFLITGVTLSGQQSGTVNLRLKLNTYLRAPMGKETTEKTVSVEPDATAGKEEEPR